MNIIEEVTLLCNEVSTAVEKITVVRKLSLRGARNITITPEEKELLKFEDRFKQKIHKGMHAGKEVKQLTHEICKEFVNEAGYSQAILLYPNHSYLPWIDEKNEHRVEAANFPNDRIVSKADLREHEKSKKYAFKENRVILVQANLKKPSSQDFDNSSPSLESKIIYPIKLDSGKVATLILSSIKNHGSNELDVIKRLSSVIENCLTQITPSKILNKIYETTLESTPQSYSESSTEHIRNIINTLITTYGANYGYIYITWGDAQENWTLISPDLDIRGSTNESREELAFFHHNLLKEKKYTIQKIEESSLPTQITGKVNEECVVVASSPSTDGYNLPAGVACLFFGNDFQRDVFFHDAFTKTASFFIVESCRRINDNILRETAYVDSLTKLPNRESFNQVIDLQLNKGETVPFALMLIDLNHFKNINDTRGHNAGDEVLKEVSSRLKNAKKDSEFMARLGGDEFILISPCYKAKEAAETAKRLQEALEKPFIIEGAEHKVSLSIGIAFFPENGATRKQLLKMTDIAMNEAKHSGINHCFYQQEMSYKDLFEKSSIKAIRNSLDKESIEILFQPQVDIINGSLTGVEALCRLPKVRNLSRSMESLISLAENTGLIIEIDQLVIEKCLQQLNAWKSEGYLLSSVVSINVSPYHLRDSKIVDLLDKTTSRHSINPTALQIEITERGLASDLPQLTETTNKLKNRGYRVSLDDFGTGLSSLSYLQNLTVDQIKIDKIFLENLADKSKKFRALKILEAIVLTSNALEISAIAEGVETKAQVRCLESIGCKYAQGYYYGKPMSGKEFASKWLTNEKWKGAEFKLPVSFKNP